MCLFVCVCVCVCVCVRVCVCVMATSVEYLLRDISTMQM